ncbi:Copia protein [Phytophthora megakarya]|uniref:Copia protein n=1 Tax=Phytophthora megakarya TaxID=4795 RepID=A0A225VES5_9STRA|nr:Copia protein [Phytophthora megakarya]
MTVGWQVKQQTTLALSKAEAEFVAAAIRVRELLGLKNLINEIGLEVEVPIGVMMDNQEAIKQLKFVRDEIDKGVIKPEYIETKYQLADLFTMRLPAPRLAELRESVGMR